MKRSILLILLIVLLTGCINNNNKSNSEESEISEEVEKLMVFDDYLEVSSPIDRYQVTMSSVPGMPLELKILKDEVLFSIDVSVSAGHFLSWEESTVEQLGSQVGSDYKDLTIYWSPLGELLIEEAEVLIEVKEDDKTIAKAIYQIVLSDDGYVLMHTVLTKD